MVRENYRNVKEQVRLSCLKAGRDPGEVTLIAVSKTKPVSMIGELLQEGVKDLGENKPQEMKEKYELLPRDLKWHMIGHLQRNKVKYIIDKACLIHSLDSLRLAETIQTEAEKRNIVMPVLVEVNMAGEESKDGIPPQEAEAFIREAAKLPNLKVKGLMTIAPFVDDPEDNRVHFRNLYNLFIDIKERNIDNVDMCILSMGMTNDFQVAVEEGATMVRVGTGIFGERQYPV